MASDLKSRVETVLNTEIMPALELEGLGIEVLGVADGIAQVRFAGSCSSCPSSTMSLIFGLEQELRARVPEVQLLEVVP